MRVYFVTSEEKKRRKLEIEKDVVCEYSERRKKVISNSRLTRTTLSMEGEGESYPQLIS